MNEIHPIKLSDLTREVKEVLRRHFQDTYWVVAEVSGHKFYPNNDRHYFELIEKEEGSNEPVAKINARAWYDGSQQIKLFEEVTGQLFTTGLEVLVKVKLEFHAAHGLALILVDIDQSFTLGNIEKQRRFTLQKLVEENTDAIEKRGEEFITRNKLTKLRKVIQHIAIIGSPNSEGYIDFTHTLQTNQYGYTCRIDIYQSSVQGAFAEKELVEKLIDIHQSGIVYDAVVMIRGGGAKTDFLVFDTYQLARACARFPIPIITGIGHHKDVSIVDMMVHTSVKTPTKAAEFIIAHNRSFEEALIRLRQDIIIYSQQIVKDARSHIQQLHMAVTNNSRNLLDIHKENLKHARHTLTHTSQQVIHGHHRRLGTIQSELKAGVKMRMQKEQDKLEANTRKISLGSLHLLKKNEQEMQHIWSVVKLMDPVHLLKKGFAILYKDGHIVTRPQQIEPGDEITIDTYTHRIHTGVINTEKHERNDPDL